MADYNSANICITEKSNKALKEKPVYDFFKRLFDIVLSVVAIILLSPILLILFIIVKATSKGPAIYKHKRVGKDGKTIYIYKFRSMVVDADKMIHTRISSEQDKKANAVGTPIKIAEQTHRII